MSEAEALVFSSRVRSSYGAKWLKFYYQAEVAVKGKIFTIEPNVVTNIADPY